MRRIHVHAAFQCDKNRLHLVRSTLPRVRCSAHRLPRLHRQYGAIWRKISDLYRLPTRPQTIPRRSPTQRILELVRRSSTLKSQNFKSPPMHAMTAAYSGGSGYFATRSIRLRSAAISRCAQYAALAFFVVIPPSLKDPKRPRFFSPILNSDATKSMRPLSSPS